jgi:hypothetical protein
MWPRFHEPPLVLPPRHAAVFRRSAASLSDQVGWDDFADDWADTEIAVFDSLTQGQKQAAILFVAKALLIPEVEEPAVTAALAVTVDVIYRELLTLIEIEMSLSGETTARRMVLEALAEMEYWEKVNSSLEQHEEPVRPPGPESTDYAEWSFLVDTLRQEILEDYDFEMAKTILDLPPDLAAGLKRQMNIDPDYFVAVVEDPSPERLQEVRSELRALLS